MCPRTFIYIKTYLHNKPWDIAQIISLWAPSSQVFSTSSATLVIKIALDRVCIMSQSSKNTLFPITPIKQIGQNFCQAIAEHSLTPEARTKIHDLKRKASNLSDISDLSTVSSILDFKDQTLGWEIAALRLTKQDLVKQVKISRNPEKQDEIKGEIYNVERALDVMEREHVVVKSNRKPISEEMVDYAYLGQTYIDDLYLSWLGTASGKASEPEFKRMKQNPRSDFQEAVGTYLGATKTKRDGTRNKFCAVLGIWLPSNEARCAHVVPRSFYKKSIAYLFGSEEYPSNSRRNGIYLANNIESAWDDGKVAIVPDGSIDAEPIEYKIVQIDPAASYLLLKTVGDKDILLKV